MQDIFLGIIGGSGIYQIEGLTDQQWHKIETPFGAPSDEILTGRLGGLRVAFLPRHGRGHVHSPSDLPYRANIDALKRLGVTEILSLSACGSFREEMAPGDFVLVDQFIDRTKSRPHSFFGAGCVAHVSMAHPTCSRLGKAAGAAAKAAGIKLHPKGTYLIMEGPQFSTLAESKLYRENMGCDVIGMTNMPEARLAREAEICYTTIAMVTDYDCWNEEYGEVDVNQVIETLKGNTAKALRLLAELPNQLAHERDACEAGCDRALEYAIMTAPEKRDPAVLAKLDAVAKRILG